MKKKLSESEALYRVTALCAGCEQCEHNIREKLKKWEIENDAIDRIIDYLYDEKYIDELRFANAYARDKMRYNHWGRQKIDQNMMLLHISPISRREALNALPSDEYRDILSGIMQSKVRSIKAESDYERNGKLIRFALGRGFEMNLIMMVLDDIQTTALDEAQETDDE